MQEKIIEELRQELKEQIEENKELNDSITWWKNRYEAQVKINEEHKKLNGELRKENDALITIIDLVREYLTGYESISTIQELENSEKNEGLDKVTMIEMVNRYMKVHDKVLEILERVNEE